MNYKIRLDLAKLQGAFLTEIKGKKETKKCICIPVDNTSIYVGTKGVYLNMIAFESNGKYDNSHVIMPQLPKTVQGQHNPIIGNLTEWVKSSTHPTTETTTPIDDVPF